MSTARFSPALAVGSLVEVFQLDSAAAVQDDMAAPLQLRGTSTAVVVACPPAADGEVHTLQLHTGMRKSQAQVGGAVGLRPVRRAFSTCSSVLDRSVGDQLGFATGATHGSTGSYALLAPSVYNLEHVDYVLIELTGAHKSGVQLHHTNGQAVTTPFCKLVMFPLFREERMLTRETVLSSGESFQHFGIRVTRPDGRPYHFHGAQFSFSLNYMH